MSTALLDRSNNRVISLAAASAWLHCTNGSSRSTQIIWGSQKTYQSQSLIPPSFAVQVVASCYFSSAPFNLRGAAHHELFCLLAPTFSLDAGFQSCTQASIRLRQETSSQIAMLHVFGLRGLVFWRYNLFKRAGKKAILTWQCIFKSK